MSQLDKINGRVKQGSPNPAEQSTNKKPRKREAKDAESKRPLWKSDWKK